MRRSAVGNVTYMRFRVHGLSSAAILDMVRSLDEESEVLVTRLMV